LLRIKQQIGCLRVAYYFLPDHIPDGYSDVLHHGNTGLFYVGRGNIIEVKTRNITLDDQIKSHVRELLSHPIARRFKTNSKPVSITFVTLANNYINPKAKRYIDARIGKQWGMFSKIIHVVPRYRINNNSMEVDFGVKGGLFNNPQFHQNSRKVKL